MDIDRNDVALVPKVSTTLVPGAALLANNVTGPTLYSPAATYEPDTAAMLLAVLYPVNG